MAVDIVIPRRALPPGPPPRRWWPWWVWLLLAVAVLFLTPPALVAALRWLPPPTTAFMLQSPTQPLQYRWVPAARIAGHARKAVIAAEDQKFYDHFGFDFEAIGKALEHNQKSKRRRGASTITQQVAKNLFLWPGRSWLRKGVEVSFTILLELLWTKDRILEVYLNVAEFGPGIYGVEAAAQKFFDKPAADLSPAEAARLAAVLPSPRRWRADRPGPYVQARTGAILRLMGHGPPPTPADEDLAAPPAEAPEDAAPEQDDAAAAAPAEESPAEEPPAQETPSEDSEVPAEMPEETPPGDSEVPAEEPEEPPSGAAVDEPSAETAPEAPAEDTPDEGEPPPAEEPAPEEPAGEARPPDPRETVLAGACSRTAAAGFRQAA